MEEKEIIQEENKVNKDLKESLDMLETEKSVQDNKISFEYKNEKYRVKRPLYSERQEVYLKKSEKHIKLLKEKNSDGTPKYLFEKELVAIYKDRGIDIEELDKKFRVLKNNEKELMLKLGEALKENKSTNELETLKKAISDIRYDMSGITITKGDYLEYSIEKQVLSYTITYFAYLLTEKLVEDKWVKAFNNFDSFISSEGIDEGLLNLCIYYTYLIIDGQEYA